MSQAIDTEICIIGSGIGGGTLATRLAQGDRRCLLVEAGGEKKPANHVTHENRGRSFGLRSTRAIQLGGTSNLWHGVLAPLDPIDFSQREWIPHSGWPISFEDLKPYYHRAAIALGAHDPEYYEPSRLPDSLRGYLNEMAFDRSVLDNKIFQQPLPPKNFRDDLRKIAGATGNVRILTGSVALELLRENGGRVRALRVGRADGTFLEVRARLFIVCAGALESPRLLLNSGFQNPNIGRFLMDHPMGNLCQVQLRNPQKAHIYSAVKYRPDCAIKSGLVLKGELQKKMRLPNHNFYMRPSFKKGIHNESEKIKLSLLAFKDGQVSSGDVWRLVTNMNVVMQILAYKFSLNATYRYADLFFVTEQVPNPESRVDLSERRDSWGYPIARVDWKLREQDFEAMTVWSRLLREGALPEQDYEFTHRFEDIDWDRSLTSAAHHVGTARMAKNEQEGVVDENLKVFGTENLFVCDGSVFTTAGNVNNGLTIAALGMRLAEHLEGKP